MVKVVTKVAMAKERTIGIGLLVRLSGKVAYITMGVKTIIGARGDMIETIGTMGTNMMITTIVALET